MFDTVDELLAAVEQFFGTDPWPSSFRLLRAMRAAQAGEEIKLAARAGGTTAKRLSDVLAAPDPVAKVIGNTLVAAQSELRVSRARGTVGSLLLAEIAERVFESIYKRTMDADELRLEDDRRSRNDTDYRVLNGKGRAVFRINIKFHGSQFRNAQELVGLEPLDCFALATYKIDQGLRKQEQEVTPYLFVIVGVPHLTGAIAGAVVPDGLAHIVSLCSSGKRDVEERVVRFLLKRENEQGDAQIAEFRKQIESAAWYVLSARRADNLLRDKLFERVYAVRVRGFAQQYRNAEVDMHFSLQSDLTLLTRFLDELKERGLPGLTGTLERGMF